MKMSKSLGNTTAPQDVIRQYGADILRLWVAQTDYSGRPAHRPGDPEGHRRQLPAAAQHAALPARRARRLRPTAERVGRGGDARARALGAAPAGRARPRGARRLRRLRLPAGVPARSSSSARSTSRRSTSTSARTRSTATRRRARAGGRRARCSTRSSTGSSPGSRRCCPSPWRRSGSSASPARTARCTSSTSRPTPATWLDPALAAKWEAVRRVRRVVTGALEVERREKRIGASLEAAPVVHVADPDLLGALALGRLRRHLHHLRT